MFHVEHYEFSLLLRKIYFSEKKKKKKKKKESTTNEMLQHLKNPVSSTHVTYFYL